MDFPPVPDLIVDGFCIAPITVVEPGTDQSGDGYLIAPAGMLIDMAWRANVEHPHSRWTPPTLPTGLGVVIVEVSEKVESEAELGPVLEAAVRVIERVGSATQGTTSSDTP